MMMKEASVGTMIVGVIFILTGIGYLNDIADSVLPTAWKGILSRELRFYDMKSYALQLQYEAHFQNQDLREDTREQNRQILLDNLEAGRRKILNWIEHWRNTETEYFLMTHPARLFMFLLVTMWLVVVGIGFLIVFPWRHWFVFVSIIINYFWQTYNFIYEKKLEGISFKYHNEINQILGMPLQSPAFQDQKLFFQILQTFICLGMLYYFSTESGKSLFREEPRHPFTDLLKERKPLEPPKLANP